MATEYERKRLENMRRNNEMMAALKVQAKASLLSAATKRPRDESKSSKKKISQEPIVVRQSRRNRGFNPDSGGLPDYIRDIPKPPRVLAPLPFDSAYQFEGSYSQFVDTILGISKKLVKGETGSVKVCKDEIEKTESEKIEFEDGFDLSLEPQNVALIVPGKISAVKFLPCQSIKMIAAGDLLGNIGFWNLDCEDEEDDGIYLFRPHSAEVSSLVFQQNNLSKVISSSYDGLIRFMDVEKLVFDLVYSNDDEKPIISLSERPNDEQSLYFSEGNGKLKVWDLRAGKSSFHWGLHYQRISTIDFNPRNPNIMATSSTDSTVCLWDLRSMGDNKKPKVFKTLNHDRSVQSGYFSPSGLSLATTSIDNYIGILSGDNFEDTCMIEHDNRSHSKMSSFRGVWGWDDSYIFVGNQSKGIDVISPKLETRVWELQSPLMKAIPSRLHCHPLHVGMIAGSTAQGEVYVWTRN